MSTWSDLQALTPPVGAEGSRRFWSGRNTARKRLREQVDDAIGKGYATVNVAYVSLIAQCDLEAYDARQTSRRWGRAYYVLGLPASVLAATAAATALASTSGRVAAGIIALVSAGLSAAVTFLDSETQRKRSDELGAGWQSLAESARVALIELKTSHAEESAAALGMLVPLNRIRDQLLRGVAPDPAQQAVRASPKPPAPSGVTETVSVTSVKSVATARHETDSGT